MGVLLIPYENDSDPFIMGGLFKFCRLLITHQIRQKNEKTKDSFEL
jgi:hypothetical protein